MSERILVALDRSENALKAVEYIARTMSKLEDIQITLFDVIPRLPKFEFERGPHLPFLKDIITELTVVRSQRKTDMDHVFEMAKKKLIEAGVSEERIKIKCVEEKKGIAKDIVGEAIKGNYGTVILGRRGTSKTRDFYFGSVTNKVTSMLQDRSIIIVGD
ncbi:MAG: hypothetical protein AMJ45_07180 [Syntrophobacter sp. DG_60]|nr:MAG: hypothetical protein AMJ45_07180 [Syntrophobacter sp. DG_60]